MVLPSSVLAAAAAAAALLGIATAQVHTDCNPTDRDGCPANPAFGTDHLFRFNTTPDSALWETTAGSVRYDANTGAAFTISKQGDSPTLRTKFYFFFGRTEIWLKVAPGRGIVSSMMWLSDDLDEVDWEFLGSNETFATTNYFGKGRQDYHNGGSHPMSGMQHDFHNYTTVWTRDAIQWFIDGSHVRTLNAADANKTQNYPQTPMRMSVGIWAGGDPSLPEGTRKWAGGDTDYAGGPYTMHLKSARITDYSTGKEYAYGDRSGAWQSIKVAAGNSTALDALNRQPDRSVAEKWNDLSAGAKAAVYAGAAAVGALALGTLLWYCVRQRRRGAAESRAAYQREQKERWEDEQYHKMGIDPDGFSAHGHGGLSSASSYHVPEFNNPFEGSFDEQSRRGSGAPGVGAMVAGATAAGGAMGPASAGRRQASPAGGVQAPSSSPHGFDFGVASSSPARCQSPSLMAPLPNSGLNSFDMAAAQGAHHEYQFRMHGDAAPQVFHAMGSPGPMQGPHDQRTQSPMPINSQGSFDQRQTEKLVQRTPASSEPDMGWRRGPY